MSQTFFSKLDNHEKITRLTQLAQGLGKIVVWIKGSQEKHLFQVNDFLGNTNYIITSEKKSPFREDEKVLINFDIKGMSFFAHGVFQTNSDSFVVFKIDEALFKSERRGSFRVMTYPMFEVYLNLQIDEVYEGKNVINLKNKKSQTGIFKTFLKMTENSNNQVQEGQILRLRVQDFSTTGLALYVGASERRFFEKDKVFLDTKFEIEEFDTTIPKLRVVYVADISSEQGKGDKFKIGIHFDDLPPTIDHFLGKTINELLRKNDSAVDFENF